MSLFYALLFILFFALSVFCEETSPSGIELPDFSVMSIYTLRKHLRERGKMCEGCFEKEDYIKKLKTVFS